jgi:hypothetical protein
MKDLGDDRDGKRRGARAWALAVLAVCVLTATPTVAATTTAFPFLDANGNGVYDPGIDSDITADLMKGSFSTTASVVIPTGARGLTTKNPAGFKISADGGVTVLAPLVVQSDGYGGITLHAREGAVVLGDRAVLKAGFVDVSAGRDVVLGRSAQVAAKGGPVVGSGWVALEAGAGNVSVGAGAYISARDDVHILAFGGGVVIASKTTVSSALGLLNVVADDDISIVGSKLRAHSVNLSTFDDLLEVRDSTVRSARDGFISVVAHGTPSTIDVRGTEWEDVDPLNLLLYADTIIE